MSRYYFRDTLCVFVKILVLYFMNLGIFEIVKIIAQRYNCCYRISRGKIFRRFFTKNWVKASGNFYYVCLIKIKNNFMDLLKEIFKNIKTIAVIGMKDDNSAAYIVPEYLYEQGYKIYPVNATRISKSALGENFTGSVTEIKDKIDTVEIFRKSEFIPVHVKEILQMNPLPKYVWFQPGIIHNDAAKELENAGIKVVQNACMMAEHRKLR